MAGFMVAIWRILLRALQQMAPLLDRVRVIGTELGYFFYYQTVMGRSHLLESWQIQKMSLLSKFCFVLGGHHCLVDLWSVVDSKYGYRMTQTVCAVHKLNNLRFLAVGLLMPVGKKKKTNLKKIQLNMLNKATSHWTRFFFKPVLSWFGSWICWKYE